jgi:hypothetical protein
VKKWGIFAMTKSNGILPEETAEAPAAPTVNENHDDDDDDMNSAASPTASSMTSSPQPQQPLYQQQQHPEKKSAPVVLNATVGNNSSNFNNNSNKQQQSSSSSSLSAAADLIKTLDSVYAEVNHSAVTTARDAEEARKNARAASEVARRYGYQSARIPPSLSSISSIPLSHSSSSSRPSSPPPTVSTPVAASAAAAASTTPTSYYFSSPPSPLNHPATGAAGIASRNHPYNFQRPPSSRYGYSSTTTTTGNYNINSTSQQYHPHENVTTSTPSSCNTSVSGCGNKDPLMTSTHSSNSLNKQQGSHYSQHTAPSSLQNLLSSPPQSEQQQAEEVLTLSLELERARQNLQAETSAHADTQQALHVALEKNESLERQLDKLVNDRETEQEAYRTRLDEVEMELTASQKRFVAAEEDAQFALELAKGNASAREQLEEQLQHALHEIQMLRLQHQQSQREFAYLQQHATSKPRVVRFADEVNPRTNININSGSILHSGQRHQQTTGETGQQLQPQTEQSVSPSSSSRPSRSMVAAGRQLFQQSSAAARGAGDNHGDALPSSSSHSPMHSVPSPADFAAKRRQQKERLRALSLAHPQLYIPSSAASLSPSTPPSPPPRDDSLAAIAAHGSSSSPSTTSLTPRPPPPPHARHNSSTELLDTCRTTARVLKESGKRLNLSGQWWTTSSSSSTSSPGGKISANGMHLDAMARHYCTAVEVRGRLDYISCCMNMFLLFVEEWKNLFCHH